MLHADTAGVVRNYNPFAAFSEVFNSGGLKSYINKLTRFDMLPPLQCAATGGRKHQHGGLSGITSTVA